MDEDAILDALEMAKGWVGDDQLMKMVGVNGADERTMFKETMSQLFMKNKVKREKAIGPGFRYHYNGREDRLTLTSSPPHVDHTEEAEFDVRVVMKYMEEAGPHGTTCTAVSKALNMDKSAVRTGMKNLKRQGYLRRSKDGDFGYTYYPTGKLLGTPEDPVDDIPEEPVDAVPEETEEDYRTEQKYKQRFKNAGEEYPEGSDTPGRKDRILEAEKSHSELTTNFLGKPTRVPKEKTAKAHHTKMTKEEETEYHRLISKCKRRKIFVAPTGSSIERIGLMRKAVAEYDEAHKGAEDAAYDKLYDFTKTQGNVGKGLVKHRSSGRKSMPQPGGRSAAPEPHPAPTSPIWNQILDELKTLNVSIKALDASRCSSCQSHRILTSVKELVVNGGGP